MTSLRATRIPSLALPAAAAGGLIAGGMTCVLQQYLPGDWNIVVNSGAVWTIVTFALAALLGRTRRTSVVAGLLVLLGEVAGYYLYLADVRHLPGLHSAELLWTMAALWIGPLTGFAAFHARWGTAAQRMTALAALAGVVAGEGVYLVRVAGVAKAGWVEIAIGGAVAALALMERRITLGGRLIAVSTGVLVTLGVYAAYRLLAYG
jgi:Family of unknown function (DUF6518)